LPAAIIDTPLALMIDISIRFLSLMPLILIIDAMIAPLFRHYAILRHYCHAMMPLIDIIIASILLILIIILII
jgi:hypothetical protein